MSKHYDTIIIGAGPSGMAAAITLSDAGASVCLLDEQNEAGGQIYRGIGQAPITRADILGKDYQYGQNLFNSFKNTNVDHVKGASVWQATAEGEVNYSKDGQGYLITAKRLLLATGAQERPMPFPGWTLPGVMPCGAGQILLKSSGIIPDSPVVIAGSGPLIYLIAAQFAKAGVETKAILETTPKSNYLDAAKHVIGAIKGREYLIKGLKYLKQIKHAGVNIQSGISQLTAIPNSDGLLDKLSYQQSGQVKEIDCSLLMVHMGVVPNLQLSRSMGCQHIWNGASRNWIADCDETGRSSQETVFIAGDSQFIMGAKASEYFGHIAAYEILRDLGKFDTSTHSAQLRDNYKAYQKHLAIRPFIDALYKPTSEFLAPADNTIICRCEEVSAKDIRGFAKLGCMGPNQTKAFGRPGMGPCQGRQCGLAVSEILAEAHKLSPEEVGYYNIRSPIKPVTLGEIASFSDD